jgi:hypothetical protein
VIGLALQCLVNGPETIIAIDRGAGINVWFAPRLGRVTAEEVRNKPADKRRT